LLDGRVVLAAAQKRVPLDGIIRVLLASAITVAIALAIHHLGVDTFLAAVRRVLPWIPVLLLLEAVRIGADALALAALCGGRARSIGMRDWIALHLRSNAALVVLPAGRAVSEGMKVARLRPVLGGGAALSVVVSLHTVTLATIALVSLGGAWAALSVGVRWLASAMVLHAAIATAGAIGLGIAIRKAVVPRKIRRWLGVEDVAVEDLRAAAALLPWVPLGTLGAKLVNRGAQIAQLGILIAALGVTSGPLVGFLASGAMMLGGALPDVSFASLGATDGAMVLAAPALSLDLAGALAVASLARAVSLVWSAVGVFVSVRGTRR
jgi:hypothetical protein